MGTPRRGRATREAMMRTMMEGMMMEGMEGMTMTVFESTSYDLQNQTSSLDAIMSNSPETKRAVQSRPTSSAPLHSGQAQRRV